ncbi:protease synthase and sporulation negative regulatory protein PAI 1 [Andreesenia angusta]|uniref:[Ribosomal protein bS18]-alanine N-acetyltransferase n=1 Tax=Andreesenia angusta TaxID=39480 RepID=A0A1S1V5B5_9FIRM|nr:ribosomal protein S18-alanine N-acetyltransferase [Andreesenia angusta]OHW61590.1 protease synthase and sporulation negative regulatory protein PAI 1 [Andreesenia angusta]
MDRTAVRDMEERDLERVAEIEALSFSSPWSIEAFRKELRENSLAVYLVCEIDGELAGYMGMWKVVDEGHVTNVAVDPKFRGMGVGNELLSEMVIRARESNLVSMTLEVRVSNVQAIGLYKKHGFKDVGTRPKYYDNGEDAIIMWKTL